MSRTKGSIGIRRAMRSVVLVLLVALVWFVFFIRRPSATQPHRNSVIDRERPAQLISVKNTATPEIASTNLTTLASDLTNTIPLSANDLFCSHFLRLSSHYQSDADNSNTAEGGTPLSSAPLSSIFQVWPAGRRYLPLPDTAVAAFYEQQARLQNRGGPYASPEQFLVNRYSNLVVPMEQLLRQYNAHCNAGDALALETAESALLTASPVPATWLLCAALVPECLCFIHNMHRTRLALLAAKCCVEHLELRITLQYVSERATAGGNASLFLMFGSLLSSARDGPNGGLVPWETDIDLGIVGAHPHDALAAFTMDVPPAFQGSWDNRDTTFFSPAPWRRPEAPWWLRTHHASGVSAQFRVGLCKTSGNALDSKRRGSCSDVHTVSLERESSSHAATLELWPYRRLTAVNESTLHRRNLRQLGIKHKNLTALYAHFFENNIDALDAFETVRKSELLLPVGIFLPLSTSHRRHHSSAPYLHCSLWGIPLRCPAQDDTFLDLEYHGRNSWVTPKTIHWGSNNVIPWQ
jgi:hypothetical protein